jgi:hypothetical protein
MLLGWLFALPWPAAAQIVPFSLSGGLVTIDATVGSQPMRMVVDLGAGLNVISAKAAARLNISGQSRYTNWRMEGERVDLPTATLPTLSLAGGQLQLKDLTTAIWPGLDGSGVDGLISATAFRDQAVTFDYVAHRLVLRDGAKLARAPGESRVPIEVSDDRSISLGIFAWFDFGKGQRGLCELDTGSQGFFLDERFGAKLGVNLDDSKLKRVPGPAGDRVVATIPELALHGLPSSALPAPKVLFTNLIYDCNVGNEFWANRTFTLDVPSGSLYVP